MNKNEELLKLKSHMLKDEKLPLKKGATNLVFGIGNADSKVLLLGEGPGYWEDQEAEPFVGRSGKLLNHLLQLIGLKREDVYITNVIHHRPPDNRDPLPEEIGAYKPYLDKIIEIIKPKIIVTLGRFSMGKFLPGVKITSVHGKIHQVNWMGKEVIIMPMYHPAAALRNPEVMRQIRDDFQKLPEILKEANKVEVKQMQLV